MPAIDHSKLFKNVTPVARIQCNNSQTRPPIFSVSWK